MQKKNFVLPKLSINYFNILNLLLVCFPVSIFIGTGAINLIVFLICSIGLIMFSKKIFIFKNNKTTSILFLFFLLLFLTTIIDGIRYPEKNNVLKALLYFRYFILFIVMSYFVKSRKLNLKYFLISISVCTIFLSLDIIYQFFNGADFFGFVGYGDNNTLHLAGFLKNEYIAGGYIQRFLIFSLVLLPCLLIKNKSFRYTVPVMLMSIFFSGILFSGNRMPLFIFIFSIILCIILIKEIRYQLLVGTIFCVTIFYFTLSTQERFKIYYESFYYNAKAVVENINDFAFKKYPDLEKNKNNYFVGEIFKGNKKYKEYELVRWGSGHPVIYLTAIDVWKDRPILGHGIKSFREKCKNKLHLPNRVCQAHPHNYYLEFLNDVGILGIVIFLIFLVLIFRERILNFKKVKVDEKLILYCLLIIIVSELFPFRSSGSFFSTQISSYIFLILGILGGFKKTKIN